MIHLLALKEGLEAKYDSMQYSRQGFIARNKHTNQQEALPIEAFEIVPVDRLLPDLYAQVEREVERRVKDAIKNAAEEIVDAATKLMEEKVGDGNV